LDGRHFDLLQYLNVSRPSAPILKYPDPQPFFFRRLQPHFCGLVCGASAWANPREGGELMKGDATLTGLFGVKGSFGTFGFRVVRAVSNGLK
jgi:hypothetical protein